MTLGVLLIADTSVGSLAGRCPSALGSLLPLPKV